MVVVVVVVVVVMSSSLITDIIKKLLFYGHKEKRLTNTTSRTRRTDYSAHHTSIDEINISHKKVVEKIGKSSLAPLYITARGG